MTTTASIENIANSRYHELSFNFWKIAAIIIAVIFFLPVASILSSLFIPNAEIWQYISESLWNQYLINSLILVIGVGSGTVIIGISTAWLVTMCDFPGSGFYKYALLLPMAFPAYIIAYTYTGIFDVTGPLQIWLRDSFDLAYGDYWFPEIRSMGGAIFVLTLVLYPYVYLLTRSALLEQSVCVLEVSRTLGCNSYNMFFRVALPLIRPAVIVGLSLVLMETLADYGTVQYFGVVTFTTGIYQTWFGLDSSLGASQLSAILLSLVVLLIFIEQYSRRQRKYFHSSNKYSTITPKKLTGFISFCSSLYCLGIIFFGFLLPFYFLLKWSFLTYATIIDNEFVMLIWNSLKLAIITGILAIGLSLFIAYGKRRFKGTLMPFILRMLSYGYAIPGVIIAVGIMLPVVWFDKQISMVLKNSFDVEVGLLISGSIFILVFAYLVRFLTISLNTLDTSLQKIKPSIDEAALSLGVKSFSMIRKIHMPMIKTSLLTAFLMIFVDVLKELPATLLLRPFNFNTLAVRTYELANEERLIDAAFPSIAIVIVGLIPVIILSQTINQSRPGNNVSSRR